MLDNMVHQYGLSNNKKIKRFIKIILFVSVWTWKILSDKDFKQLTDAKFLSKVRYFMETRPFDLNKSNTKMFVNWLPVIGGFKITCTFFSNS